MGDLKVFEMHRRHGKCRECNELILYSEETIMIGYYPQERLHFHRGDCFKTFQKSVAEIDGRKKK